MKNLCSLLRQSRFWAFGLMTVCIAAAAAAVAQSPAPRISTEINSSETARLKGSLDARAQPDFDAGRMPAGNKLAGITITFKLSDAQQADLDNLIAAQQNPASPLYHQWLTPEQYAARFGMAQSDLQKVQTWLEQQGFSVDSVARGRNSIRFSGTVGQVEQAFQTEMHYYNVQSVRHFAPATELSVPAAVAPVIAGIRSLNDFRPRPLHMRSEKMRSRPAYTMAGQTPQFVFFAPGDIAVAYDIKPLYSASENGTGQTIAIIGQSAIQASDITNFQSAAGLATKTPNLMLVPNTGSSEVFNDGDEGESDIDIEWSGAVATGATIDFVYSGNSPTSDVFDALTYVVDNKIAPIISSSYGECELEAQNDGTITSLEPVLQQAMTQGQTVISAAGDTGSTDCYVGSGVKNPPALTTQEALSADYPASSQYVTALGGTEISQTNAAYNEAPSAYWTQATGSNDQLTSALQYIPEQVWNDSKIDVQQFGATSLSSGGGGVSTIYSSKPSWQTGVPGIPSDNKRDLPDVSLYASPDYPGYLYCTSDQSDWSPAGNGFPAQAASCNSGFYDSFSGDLTVAGGTSFAAPIFAGMMAIVNQDRGYTSGSGFLNQTLYTLAANSTTYGSAFHDITVGNNECPAALGGSFCSSTSGGETNYSATTGFDLASGLGSVDLNNLATAWPSNTGPALVGTTTSVTTPNSSPSVNTNVAFTITVTAADSSTPGGTVSVSVDGGTAVTETLASNGTFVYTTSFTTAGQHTVSAQFPATSKYAGSTGSSTVNVQTVSSGKGTITLSASPSTLTVTQGTTGSETITVTPAAGYTGTVLLIFDTNNDNALANLCYDFPNITSSGYGPVLISGTAAASTTLTLDTNAADCVSGQAQKSGKPMRRLGNSLTAKKTTPTNPASPIPAGIAFAGLLLVGFLGRYSRKFSALAGLVALIAVGLTISACGGGISGNTVTNPPKGTYTVTVMGQDSSTSSITGSTTFTLTIQ